MRLDSKTLLPLAALVTAASAPAQGGPNSIPSVVITLENQQPFRGVLLTPPWIGIHDGSFDIYNPNAPASTPLGGNEVESLAEDGNNGPISATFAALLPNAPQRMGVASATGPLSPGQRTAVTLNVNPMTDRYFSFASMVIPSNDAFIANGNPFAYPLFDGAGQFVGQNFIISGDQTHDAGTEVNDEVAGNTAFLAQAAPNTGTPEALGVQTPSPGFAPAGMLPYPNGVLNYPVFGNGDFNDPDDRLLRVSFRFVDLGSAVRYGAALSTSQEVQPLEIDTGGRGFARVLSLSGQNLRLHASTTSLSGPITSAHLHLGPAGSNGPVIVDVGAGISANGIAVMFNASAANLTGPLAGASFVTFLNELAAGNVYLNLHTAQFPMGEVRGQVQLAD